MTQMTSRHDLYNTIHKGLRRALAQLLVEAGQTDGSPADQQALATRWDAMRFELHEHHHHEDLIITPHLDRIVPALSHSVSQDHVTLGARIERLSDLALSMAAGVGTESERGERGKLFYRGLADFVALFFLHMAAEEGAVQSALEQAYSDEEIIGIEMAIVASIPHDRMAAVSILMFGAMNPTECAASLDAMRRSAPPPVFAGMCQLAQSVITPGRWSQVRARLDLAPTSVRGGTEQASAQA